MFRNLINRHDLADLLRQGSRGISKTIGRFLTSQGHRAEKTLCRQSAAAPIHWWDIPEIHRHWNAKITGDPALHYRDYFISTYLAAKEGCRALSVGCGVGHREIEWAQRGKFERIDAYDLVEERIVKAKEAASRRGLDHVLNFQAADAFAPGKITGQYDVIFGEHSIHHFSPLDIALKRLGSFLKEDGYLFVNEFVGPDRFQWTDRQMELANSILGLLPKRYGKGSNGLECKKSVRRLSKFRMWLRDPSEAVESSNILPLLERNFEILERKPYGGTILHLVFEDLAANFLNDDNPTKEWLKILFEIEDLLLEAGEIESDFVYAVCRRKR